MSKHDFFAEYKSDSRNIFKKTIPPFKSYLKLKGGYVLDKNNELRAHKNFIKNMNYIYAVGDIQKIKQISGIHENLQDLQIYINKLPKYSFAIWFKFRLKAPYFSKDDDEFYIIQNPIIKETNFKVPMIRGSSWKGALAHAFRELFKENPSNNGSKIESFLRIFGASSESLRIIEEYISDKVKNLEEVKGKLIDFLLFELGTEINKDIIEEINNIKDKSCLINFLQGRICQKLKENQKDLPIEFQTHRGRAIFYPTYFNKLSLEIINPHDRRKRAGINPIHYEVVPKGAEGIFQLIYIPFDGLLKSKEELVEEVKEDLRNLVKAIDTLQEKGVGAKTKLGWGRFDVLEIFCFKNW